MLTTCNNHLPPFNVMPYNATGFCGGPTWSVYLTNFGCSCVATGTVCSASSTDNPCFVFNNQFGGAIVETPAFWTSDPFAEFPTNLSQTFSWVTKVLASGGGTGTSVGSHPGGRSNVVHSKWGLYSQPSRVNAVGVVIPAVPNASVWAAVAASPAAAGTGFLGLFPPKIVERKNFSES